MITVKAFSRFALMLLVALNLAGANSHAENKISQSSKTPDLVFGMSTALSGPTQLLGKSMLSGVQTAFAAVNASGGVYGQQLKLIALDDGYEPARTGPNMRSLISDHHVLAVIGNVGAQTAVVAVPIVNEQKVLLFAPFTGAGVLRKASPDRYVINFRAGFDDEMRQTIDALIDQAKLHPSEIAFFTQRDAFGDSVFAGAVSALKRRGLTNEQEIVHLRFERNTTAVEGAVADLIIDAHQPKAVVMAGTYAPAAKFIRLARASGFKALFINVSFVGTGALLAELGADAENVIVTQVVPHYLSDLPLVQDYHRDLAQIKDFDVQPASYGGLEGYIAARLLIKALRDLPLAPTREQLIDKLEAFGDFDLGIGETLNLSKSNHQASHRVWPTIIRQGKVVPLEWNEIAQLPKEKR